MKVINQMIQYLEKKEILTAKDIAYLRQEGFYSPDSKEPKSKHPKAQSA